VAPDLEAVPSFPEVVGVVDGPGGEPEDPAFQRAQAGKLAIGVHGAHDIAWEETNQCVSSSNRPRLSNIMLVKSKIGVETWLLTASTAAS
jgi:hypothetical protein